MRFLWYSLYAFGQSKKPQWVQWKIVFLIRAVVDLILQCVTRHSMELDCTRCKLNFEILHSNLKVWMDSRYLSKAAFHESLSRVQWLTATLIRKLFTRYGRSMSCVWTRLFIINFLAEYSGSQRLWILIIFSPSSQRTWVFNHDFVLHLVFCLI